MVEDVARDELYAKGVFSELFSLFEITLQSSLSLPLNVMVSAISNVSKATHISIYKSLHSLSSARFKFVSLESPTLYSAITLVLKMLTFSSGFIVSFDLTL